MSSRSDSVNVAIRLSMSRPSQVDGSIPSDRDLLNEAIIESEVTGVDVNEQNSGACGVYLNRGFAQVGRDKLDGDGRPYPMLHLELNR